MSNYVTKKACAPGKDFENTCYDLDALHKIARSYNQKHKNNPIPIVNDKKEQWQAIRKSELGSKCDTEWCWIQQDFTRNLRKSIEKNTFKPAMPAGKYELLSNDDIDYVLMQYSNTDPEFRYMGSFPIDFGTKSKLKSFSLANQPKGVKKWGFVFNTDKTGGPGEHWIAMYVELFTGMGGMRFGTVDFFDSYGYDPKPEVKKFIEKLLEQGRKMGYSMTVNVNKRRHQFKNSECGVYVINFIVNRMLGVPFSRVSNNIKNDEKMNALRKEYFNPMSAKF